MFPSFQTHHRLYTWLYKYTPILIVLYASYHLFSCIAPLPASQNAQKGILLGVFWDKYLYPDPYTFLAEETSLGHLQHLRDCKPLKACEHSPPKPLNVQDGELKITLKTLSKTLTITVNMYKQTTAAIKNFMNQQVFGVLSLYPSENIQKIERDHPWISLSISKFPQNILILHNTPFPLKDYLVCHASKHLINIHATDISSCNHKKPFVANNTAIHISIDHSFATLHIAQTIRMHATLQNQEVILYVETTEQFLKKELTKPLSIRLTHLPANSPPLLQTGTNIPNFRTSYISIHSYDMHNIIKSMPFWFAKKPEFYELFSR